MGQTAIVRWLRNAGLESGLTDSSEYNDFVHGWRQRHRRHAVRRRPASVWWYDELLYTQHRHSVPRRQMHASVPAGKSRSAPLWALVSAYTVYIHQGYASAHWCGLLFQGRSCCHTTEIFCTSCISLVVCILTNDGASHQRRSCSAVCLR